MENGADSIIDGHDDWGVRVVLGIGQLSTLRLWTLSKIGPLIPIVTNVSSSL